MSIKVMMPHEELDDGWKEVLGLSTDELTQIMRTEAETGGFVDLNELIDDYGGGDGVHPQDLIEGILGDDEESYYEDDAYMMEYSTTINILQVYVNQIPAHLVVLSVDAYDYGIMIDVRLADE